ncbi:MAG: response regulator [Chloroflexota bacterium]|nr:MAG: response regulator [Chloroflexota bacterium]
MDKRCRVFVVEHDVEMEGMLKVAIEQDPGCEVRTALATAPDNFDRIKEYAPDLVILDFIRWHTENWRLLDRLRADEATSSIPVLSFSTLEPVVEQTVASYNVRKTLTKPFELADLSRAIRDILSQPRVTVPPTPQRPGAEDLREAADILILHTRQVIADWLRRLNQIEPFKSQQRLRPSQLINEMPVLLWGTIVALRTGDPTRVFREQPAFRGAAVEHALLRRKQGIELAALVREYNLLRDTIWESLRDKSPAGRWSAETVFRVGELVHRALDEIVIIAVESYGQAESGEAA